MACVDPLLLASNGFLSSEGTCADPLARATQGYIIIEEDARADLKISSEKIKKGLTGGGPSLKPGSFEEDEEILLVIRLFLEYHSRYYL